MRESLQTRPVFAPLASAPTSRVSSGLFHPRSTRVRIRFQLLPEQLPDLWRRRGLHHGRLVRGDLPQALRRPARLRRGRALHESRGGHRRLSSSNQADRSGLRGRRPPTLLQDRRQLRHLGRYRMHRRRRLRNPVGPCARSLWDGVLVLPTAASRGLRGGSGVPVNGWPTTLLCRRQATCEMPAAA
jgi:hypothetical protein